MDSFEFNKIAGAVFLAGIFALAAGFLADAFYNPNPDIEKRGFSVEVKESSSTTTAKAEEEAVDLIALMASANPEKGQSLMKKCVSCHSMEKGGPHKIGPNLWDLVGKPKAKAAGYAYSTALKEAGGDWTYEDLYAFLRKPKKYLPGTKMSFIGIKKPQKVADAIAHLRTLSDAPTPLPTK